MFLRWVAALVLSAAWGMPARGEPVAEFYRDKQVNLIVGHGPGGGHDNYARLLAPCLGRYLPGSPSVVVQNLSGGASLRAGNYLYNDAPKDGTAIGVFSRHMPLMGILGGNPNVQFDARRFTWLGSSSSFVNDAYILIVRKDAPVKSIDEARRQDLPPLVLGSATERPTGAGVPILLRDTIGLHVKQVVGYAGTKAIFAAIERGEVHGRTVALSSVKLNRPDWLRPDGNYRILVQFARATRHPELPMVPMARELAKSEAARDLIELAEIPYAFSRPFAAPPHVPADRAQALQAAFLALHRDAKYLEEAAKLGIDVSPIAGEKVLQAIDRIARAPPGLLEYLRKLEIKGGG
jgi:tripartite-type tricarboxylate transporter receptor subunit TctC